MILHSQQLGMSRCVCRTMPCAKKWYFVTKIVLVIEKKICKIFEINDLSVASTKTKYIKLNNKTQNIFCHLNENLMTLTGATRKQKKKKKVFSFKVYTKVECY